MAGTKPRRGRPPKISRDDIARTALELGLDQATIRTVAEQLGVSVMGIYHHVRNAEGLRDLAISRELGTLLGPIETMASFEEVLLDTARRYYALLTDHPEMLSRLVSHSIDAQQTGLFYERILSCAVRHGLTQVEASRALRCVLMAAAGSAAMAERKHELDDQSFRGLLERGLDANADRPMPHVAALLQTDEIRRWDPMDSVRLVIMGLRECIGNRLTAGAVSGDAPSLA